MDRRFGRGNTDEATRIVATHAMSWMIDGMLLSMVALDQPRLRQAVGSAEQLAETLSALWYRAIFGADPDPDLLENAKPLLDFHLPTEPSGAGRE
jgi:hypothetical protein